MNEKLKKIQEEKQNIILAMNDPNFCMGTASTYSRISGYYRPIQGCWNEGKAQEYKERKEYKLWQDHEKQQRN